MIVRYLFIILILLFMWIHKQAHVSHIFFIFFLKKMSFFSFFSF